MVTGLCVHAIGAEVSEGWVPAHAAFLSSLHVPSSKKPKPKKVGFEPAARGGSSDISISRESGD